MQFTFGPKVQVDGGRDPGQVSLFVNVATQGVDPAGAADTRATEPTIIGAA
jgi:hypothetical protein